MISHTHGRRHTRLPTGRAILVRCACPTRPVRTAAPMCACSSQLACEVCSSPTTTCSFFAPCGGYPVVWIVPGCSCGPFGGRCCHGPVVVLLSTHVHAPDDDAPHSHIGLQSVAWLLDGDLRACAAVCDRQGSSGGAFGAWRFTAIANFRDFGAFVGRRVRCRRTH